MDTRKNNYLTTQEFAEAVVKKAVIAASISTNGSLKNKKKSALNEVIQCQLDKTLGKNFKYLHKTDLKWLKSELASHLHNNYMVQAPKLLAPHHIHFKLKASQILTSLQLADELRELISDYRPEYIRQKRVQNTERAELKKQINVIEKDSNNRVRTIGMYRDVNNKVREAKKLGDIVQSIQPIVYDNINGHNREAEKHYNDTGKRVASLYRPHIEDVRSSRPSTFDVYGTDPSNNAYAFEFDDSTSDASVYNNDTSETNLFSPR